jgi:hypothetical protein
MLAQRVGRDEDGVLFNEPLLGRKFKNRRYNGTLEKELNDFNLMATTDYQKSLLRFQSRFFEIVQLGRVTRFAREFAYDAGAFRAFDLGKLASKGKLKQARLRELNSLGLSVEDAKYLGQFKNMDEAYANVQGKFLIDKAGRKAANRDALIPQVGNRRLFAQSRTPWMKFAGSFLSWAQAKTTQTNSLLRRIEDGDGKLALMMLTTLPLYGTIRYLQTQLNPTESFREEFQSPLETKEDLLKFLADTGIFSAQLMPYWADKIFSSYKYNKNNAVENIYPVFGIVNDAVAGGFDIVSGKPRTGVVKVGETIIPGIKEVTRREALLKEEVEDFKAKDTEDETLPRMATGGLITGPEVPDTKENPADRVDPFTKQPYSDQMARLGFSQGGNIDEVLAKQLFNIDAKWQRNHEAESADLVNKKIDEGIFPERARIPVNPHTGWVEMTNQTDEEIFNKVNHQRLAYKLGDSNLKFAGLQVREGLSVFKDVAGRVSGKDSKDNFRRKLLDSQLDFLNNRVGFDLRKKGLTLEEAENEIVNNTIIDFNLQPKELGL